MLMAGKVMGQVLVMARCQIVLSEKYGCVLRIGVRSESEGVVQTIISLLHWCVCCAFVMRLCGFADALIVMRS